MFENWVLRKILRPKKEEITKDWWTLHKKEILGLYSSAKIMVIRWKCDRWDKWHLSKRENTQKEFSAKPCRKQSICKTKASMEE
jgi:hypothetical protein